VVESEVGRWRARVRWAARTFISTRVGPPPDAEKVTPGPASVRLALGAPLGVNCCHLPKTDKNTRAPVSKRKDGHPGTVTTHPHARRRRSKFSPTLREANVLQIKGMRVEQLTHE
jgi:hypothetical protein